MIRSISRLAAAATLALCMPERAAAQPAPGTPGATLQAFGSTNEIAAFQARLRREAEEWRARQPQEPPMIHETPMSYYLSLVAPPDPAGTPQQRERPVPPDDPEESLRSTGGDERPVAHVHGDHLVQLHRGRLFTTRIGGGALRPVSAVDAFGPHVGHSGAYHDELLVAGDRAVVIGTNDRLPGTEIGVFHVAADGRLAHRATYHLRSGHSLSPPPYAARVQGGRLVFYAQMEAAPDPSAPTPVLFRWGADSSRVHTAIPPTRIYRPAGPVAWNDRLAMHAVMTCDLAGDDLRCEATALMAPPARVYHAGAASVYLWTARRGGGSMLYRMPLDGSAPTALRVSGLPADPFSFLESGDGHLNVLLDPDAGRGLALLRLPLAALGDGSQAAAEGHYRPLPSPGAAPRGRFVGDWLVYGGGVSRGAFAVRWAAESAVERIPLPHAVQRIEPMGRHAVLVGPGEGGLHLTTLRLDAGAAVPAHHHVVAGETRSHGFFYRPDGDEAGVLGLPVRSTERPPFTGPGYPGMAPVPPGPPLFLGPTRILFLRSRGLRLEEMGELAAGAPSGNDACAELWCGLWYRNAQPLFADGRAFALLGYELVEGREAAGRMRELRRVGFAPAPPTAGIAGDWTFYEYIGAYRSAYYCSQRGTMRMDLAGGALAVRYRQTGECTIDGATAPNDGEGSAAGTVGPADVRFQSGPCLYTGRMASAHQIEGEILCAIPGADGTARQVRGSWLARRAPP